MSTYDRINKTFKRLIGRPARVGLVLGGGGARGIAHVGILKVLAEHRVPIHYIAGTSSGALFGALFSGGMNPYDMGREARLSGWAKLVTFKLSKSGPIFGEGIEKLVRNSIGDVRIEDLRIPLRIVTTDLKTGEKVVISKGNAARAVHASSAIPGLFSPVEFEGRLLSDGLVVDNVPVLVAKEMGADFIIAVDVIPDVILGQWKPNVFSVIERALDISCRGYSTESKKLADIVINPIHKNISALSLDQSDELIRMGEAAALDALPAIRRKLDLK